MGYSRSDFIIPDNPLPLKNNIIVSKNVKALHVVYKDIYRISDLNIYKLGHVKKK